MQSQDETEYRSFPLVDNTIAPTGLPNPYGSAQDTRTEDITQLHSLPAQIEADSDTANDIQHEYLEIRPKAETPRFTPEKQIVQFSTTVAVDANIDLSFKAQAIRIDNLTSQWIFLLQFRRWLPPFWYGAVFQGTGISSVTIIFQSPPGITQPAAIANGIVIGIAHSERLTEVDGEGLAGTGGTTLAGLVQGVSATGSTAPTNPVLIGIQDNAGNIEPIKGTTTGLPSLVATNTVDGIAATYGLLVDSAQSSRPLAALQFVSNGATYDRVRTPNIFKDVNAAAVGAIATVWTPSAGKKFRLMGGIVSVSAAVNLLFEDNAGGNFVFRVPKLLVDTPLAFTLGGNGFLSAAANNVLKCTSSAAANLTATLYGTEE
jgi:hypothetical protein